MPTYSYECVKCGHNFDVFHSMTANPRMKCEVCKGRCQRLLGSGSGIIFKGSGFYETDYKDKKGTPPKKEASKAAASSDKSDGKGPEKKSDAGKTTTDAKGTAKAAASKD